MLRPEREPDSTFTSTGARSGVSGDWSAEENGFTLTWNRPTERGRAARAAEPLLAVRDRLYVTMLEGAAT